MDFKDIPQALLGMTAGLNGSFGFPGCRVEVKDLGEKIGGVFGEKGRELGRKIDDKTKDVNIHIGL